MARPSEALQPTASSLSPAYCTRLWSRRRQVDNLDSAVPPPHPDTFPALRFSARYRLLQPLELCFLDG